MKRSSRSSRLASAALALSFLAAAGGCTSVAAITNADSPSCAGSFEKELASILEGEGEKADVAATLARDSAAGLSGAGPRPFLVSSPSGVDYELFVQSKPSKCLLRLYSRQKGFSRYTNNLTYIATRPLEGCACSE
jgi:hypothetical protein